LQLHCIPSKVEDESFEEPLSSHFVSIIDITYNGHSMLSRVISGFPGTEEFEWFESCPFQFDLLEVPYEFNGIWKDEEGITSIAIETNMVGFPNPMILIFFKFISILNICSPFQEELNY